jgi:hypothetical protein
MHFLIQGVRLPHKIERRPDVEATYGSHCTGFLIQMDLIRHFAAIKNNELSIHVAAPGEDPVPLRFRVASGVLARCLEDAGGA